MRSGRKSCTIELTGLPRIHSPIRITLPASRKNSAESLESVIPLKIAGDDLSTFAAGSGDEYSSIVKMNRS
jgi:hypothetical protein